MKLPKAKGWKFWQKAGPQPKKKAKARRRAIDERPAYETQRLVNAIDALGAVTERHAAALDSLGNSLRSITTEDGKALRIALARPFVVEIEKPVRVDVDVIDSDVPAAIRGFTDELAVRLGPVGRTNGRSRR